MGHGRPPHPPGETRRPTLRDVAAAADASIKTVSRVVNHEGGVSPELAARVEAAIENLGYRRDDRARHLRSGSTSTGTIGLVQNDVANPFFAAIFKGVEEVTTAEGCVVLSASSGGQPERQDEIIGTFISRRVDGLVVVPVGGSISLLANEIRLGTPVVFVDLMPEELLGDVVISDHFGGALRATRHLIGYGHQRIGFLGDDARIYSADQRYGGYVEALSTAGLEVDPTLVRLGVIGAPAAAGATRELMAMSHPPTAIFAAQNFISMGVVRTLRELDLAHRIAVVGFDDIDFADILEPGLSVAPQDPHELGRRAATLLFRRLAGESGPPRVEVLPVGLIERGSGELPAPPAPVRAAP